MATPVEVSGRRSGEGWLLFYGCQIWERACFENWGHGAWELLPDRAQRDLPPLPPTPRGIRENGGWDRPEVGRKPISIPQPQKCACIRTWSTPLKFQTQRMWLLMTLLYEAS